MCGTSFPIIDGIPVLINDESSVFSIEDFVEGRNTTFNLRRHPAVDVILRWIPDIGHNLRARANYARLVEMASGESASPRVLILGGSIPGLGSEPLLSAGGFELVETDVSFGPRTKMICDAHDIPFEDETFDVVVAQAVLEHVADPWRCVEEIHRVLRVNGLVYAETPFMQQVHMGRFDFTRFTLLGHRRLFRRFEEVDSGATGGPGMALAWSYLYFLWSFFTWQPVRRAIYLLARVTGFFWKYSDHLTANRPAGLDGACGCYFLGRKSDRTLSDREIIRLYRGAM